MGIFQMEPATYYDIWDNVINTHPVLRSRIMNLLYGDIFNDVVDTEELTEPSHINLMTNNLLAAIMCRAHYWRFPEPIPEHDDLKGLARYWKKYYNTPKGKGTESEFINNYLRYIGSTES